MHRLKLLALTGTCLLLQAAPNPKIRVTLGEPNAWSLEQAHYLLEQRTARNQTLRPKEPLPEDLDPNAISGNRFQALRQTFSAGVSFDQSLGPQNAAAEKRLSLDVSSYESNRTALANSLVKQKELSDKIASLGKSKRTAAEAGASDSVLKAYDTEIGGQQTLLDAEKRDADRINASMANVPTAIKTPDAPKTDFSQFPASAIGGLLGDKAAFNDPKTQASTALDNYLNFQMELLMKQVTLLRDATPPSRRIVFLELPQSFQVAGDSFWQRVRDRVVKVQWRIVSYTRPVPNDDAIGPASVEKLLDKPYLRRDLIHCMERLYNKSVSECALPAGTGSAEEQGKDAKQNQFRYQTTQASAYIGREKKKDVKYDFALVEQVTEPKRTTISGKGTAPMDPYARRAGEAELAVAGTTRVIDMVPRIGALNVNDKNYVSNGLALTGAFRWITGWGASAAYQRQKETYEQFIHQDIFAAAYGKGDPDFGWVFGPNPGSRVLAPGIRTTYATLEVPTSALGLTLEGRTCTYERADVQPAPWDEDEDCGSTQVFHVMLPTRAQSDFWVDGVKFRTAAPGARQIVTLLGGYFSTLTGVAVDGVPMRRSVAISNPELTPLPRADSAKYPNSIVSGEFEIIAGRQMLIAFTAGPDYVGTPQITVTSPIHSFHLNSQKLKLDGDSLDERALKGEVMFAPPPKVTDYSISGNSATGYILHLSGQGFRTDTSVEVGGNSLTGSKTLHTTERLDVSLANRTDFEADSVRVTVFNQTDPVSKAFTAEFPGPYRPVVTKVEAVGRHCIDKDCKVGPGAHNYWLFHVSGHNLTGVGLTAVAAPNGAPMKGTLSGISSSEFLLNIDQSVVGTYAIVSFAKPGTAALSQYVAFRLPTPDAEDKYKDKELIIKRIPK